MEREQRESEQVRAAKSTAKVIHEILARSCVLPVDVEIEIERNREANQDE